MDCSNKKITLIDEFKNKALQPKTTGTLHNIKDVIYIKVTSPIQIREIDTAKKKVVFYNPTTRYVFFDFTIEYLESEPQLTPRWQSDTVIRRKRVSTKGAVDGN